MSNGDRLNIMERMVEFCGEHGLNEVYGVIENDAGQYRSLTFCKSNVLDGDIRIYSPNFIQIRYETAYRDLPHKDSRVFVSETDALQFLKSAFVDLNFAAALAVPVK